MDTQLLGGPACHTQSMRQYPPGASFGRRGILDGPDHPVADTSGTSGSTALLGPGEPAQRELPQRRPLGASEMLPASPGFNPCAFALTMSG